MSKLKPGDKVRVVGNSKEYSAITMATMASGACEILEVLDCLYVVYTPDKSDYFTFAESDLELVEKTWDTLEVGDVIESKYTRTARVLAVCGEAFLRSMWDDHKVASTWCAITEAKKVGWKIQQSTPSEPETIEILGKTYRKADVEGRLSGLEEV